MWARLIVLLFFLLAGPEAIRAQESPALRFGGTELTVGGRLQTQVNTTSMPGVQPTELGIRRARVELGARINDVVSGVIHPEFGGTHVELKDAYVRFDLARGFGILAGHTFRPFGLIETSSSKRYLPIEAGLRIRGLQAADPYALFSSLGYGNRDVGIQMVGSPPAIPLGFEYALGVFRGPLHGQVGPQNSYQLAGRGTIRPIPELRLGLGWSARHFRADAGPEPDLDWGHALEVDLEYGSYAPGPHIIAELSHADVDPVTGARFWGAQGWFAYRTASINEAVTGIEPLLRVGHTSRSDSAPSLPGGTLVTPGINVYFGPLNRIMLNYDVWSGAGGSEDARSLKLMFQLGF